MEKVLEFKGKKLKKVFIVFLVLSIIGIILYLLMDDIFKMVGLCFIPFTLLVGLMLFVYKLKFDSKVNSAIAVFGRESIIDELSKESTLNFDNEFFATDNYLICSSDLVFSIVRYEEIVWMYIKSLNSYGNIHNNIMVCTKDKKKILFAPTSSLTMNDVEKIFSYAHIKNNNIFYGFNSDNIKKYKSI